MAKNQKLAVLAAIFISFIFLFVLSSNEILANQELEENLEPLIDTWKLEKFLEKYQSPLIESSGKFIEVSEKYDIDWKVLVSISGIESGFGKHIPYNSFNPFGYGNGKFIFSSFDESIDILGKYLFDLKHDGVYKIEDIGPIYTPPNYRNWIVAVNYFIQEINNFKL